MKTQRLRRGTPVRDQPETDGTTGAIGTAAALRAGIGYRSVYLALAAVMAVGLLVSLSAAIPAPPVPAGASSGRRPPRMRVWRIPAVLFAIALISVTFFGDGALESFPSSYLQSTLAGGVLLSGIGIGIGIGSYHCASLLGRLITVTTADLAGAISGLLLVGFAIAPVVPTTLSLAGRLAPGRSGQAVAATTATGYSAFIVSPLTIGLLAQATSLRLALALLILTSLAIAGLATRWPALTEPGGSHEAPLRLASAGGDG